MSNRVQLIETLMILERQYGSENVDEKVDSWFFSLRCNYSNSITIILSKVGELSWS